MAIGLAHLLPFAESGNVFQQQSAIKHLGAQLEPLSTDDRTPQQVHDNRLAGHGL